MGLYGALWHAIDRKKTGRKQLKQEAGSTELQRVLLQRCHLEFKIEPSTNTMQHLFGVHAQTGSWKKLCVTCLFHSHWLFPSLHPVLTASCHLMSLFNFEPQSKILAELQESTCAVEVVGSRNKHCQAHRMDKIWYSMVFEIPGNPNIWIINLQMF